MELCPGRLIHETDGGCYQLPSMYGRGRARIGISAAFSNLSRAAIIAGVASKRVGPLRRFGGGERGGEEAISREEGRGEDRREER